MWQGEGAWIAAGVSVLFLVDALLMHRVFVKILQTEPLKESSDD